MADNQTTAIPFHVWLPITKAPDNELVLLAWCQSYDGYDYVAQTGFIVGGKYVGDDDLLNCHGQPDWFMRFRDVPEKPPSGKD